MAREQRRLLIAPERLALVEADAVLPLSNEESRYLTRVLRYSAGACFAVVDGCGHLWQAELLERDEARLLQSLETPLQDQPAQVPRLVLAAAVVKRDFDLVVRMAVELGVDRLVPLLCERTAVLGQIRSERWQTIAAEAAEQCERLWMPRIDEPTPVQGVLEQPAAATRYWATTRRGSLPLLQPQLQATAGGAADELWLACGPEGGWSESEEGSAAAAGWIPVQLGPTILRSSTASVAGMALLSHWRAGL
jgi:16S rRNA (uracil1498-N3)-methyltransferase